MAVVGLVDSDVGRLENALDLNFVVERNACEVFYARKKLLCPLLS